MGISIYQQRICHFLQGTWLIGNVFLLFLYSPLVVGGGTVAPWYQLPIVSSARFEGRLHSQRCEAKKSWHEMQMFLMNITIDLTMI